MQVNTLFAHDPADSYEIGMEKFAIFLVASLCCVAAVLWSSMYIIVFGWGLTAFLPVLFILIVGGALLISQATRNHYYAVYAQIFSIIYITAFIQWSIGGVFDSGFVLAWALMGPIIALIFFSLPVAFVFLLAALLNVAITVLFNPLFSGLNPPVPENTRIFFFAMNVIFSALIIFGFAAYFVTQAVNEREKANRLLLNILPGDIAERLKQKHGIIANQYRQASILFADVVDFTPLSATLTPDELVSLLNEVFSYFDDLADRHGLEKIKTIGDCYMVAAGVPLERLDHALAITQMAVEMRDFVASHRFGGRQLSFRIGINSGPVVAGVIGHKKFIYDLWGDAVNTASRMEANGRRDTIQVTAATYDLIKGDFICTPQGTIRVKGKGEMPVWYVEQARPISQESDPVSVLEQPGG